MNRTKSKKLVKEIINRFVELGPLTSRSMFGGYGICHNSIMFALVSDNALYLRADANLAQEFVLAKMPQYIFSKRGLPLPLNYYQVTDQQWQNDDELTLLFMRSLSSALIDKDKVKNQKGQRLKDLPNMNASLERSLWRVGIVDVDELCQLGAVKTYLKLKEQSTSLGVNILFSLAGAIEGCHSAVLPEYRRNQLISELTYLQVA